MAMTVLYSMDKVLDKIVVKCSKKSYRISILVEFLVFAQIVFNGVMDYRMCTSIIT